MSTSNSGPIDSARSNIAESIAPTTKHTLEAKLIDTANNVADAIRPDKSDEARRSAANTVRPSNTVDQAAGKVGAAVDSVRETIADAIQPTTTHTLEAKLIDGANSVANSIRPSNSVEKAADRAAEDAKANERAAQARADEYKYHAANIVRPNDSAAYHAGDATQNMRQNAANAIAPPTYGEKAANVAKDVANAIHDGAIKVAEKLNLTDSKPEIGSD